MLSYKQKAFIYDVFSIVIAFAFALTVAFLMTSPYSPDCSRVTAEDMRKMDSTCIAMRKTVDSLRFLLQAQSDSSHRIRCINYPNHGRL